MPGITVDPDSNYCFGEGGAGTYSDGKLYTRSHKRGDIRGAWNGWCTSVQTLDFSGGSAHRNEQAAPDHPAREGH